jgi:GntR family transcriptional regulator
VVLASEIDRRSGIPLYLQIRQQVLALIDQRQLHAGEALPSETELQEAFHVSRATVRHTLALLEREGIVERHQGRGTFVALPRLRRKLPELTSFSEHLADQQIRSASSLLAFERLEDGDREARLRRLSEDEPNPAEHFPGQPVVRFKRLRLANDTAIGIHTTLTPAWLADRIGLTDARLRREPAFSFYAAIERSGHRLAWAEEHLVARGASRAEAEVLGVAPGTPVMSVLRLSRSGDDQLIEAVRAVYLGDKYDYVIHLERRGRQRERPTARHDAGRDESSRTER